MEGKTDPPTLNSGCVLIKVTRAISEQDALNILSLVSLAHRRIDQAIEAYRISTDTSTRPHSRYLSMKYDMRKSIKGAELKALFSKIPDDADVSFGPVLNNHVGSLTISRLKRRDENLLNVEFNEDFEVTNDPFPSE